MYGTFVSDVDFTRNIREIYASWTVVATAVYSGESTMKIRYLAAAGLAVVSLSQAQGATVNIGGTYAIDTTLGVTSVSDRVGSFAAHTTNTGGYPQFATIGNTLGTVYNADYSAGLASEDRLSFNNYENNTNGPSFTGSNPNASIKTTFGGAIYNNVGVDIYIFESGTPSSPGNNQFELLAASVSGASGSWVTATQIGFLYANPDLGNAMSGGTGFGLYVYGIDLSDLGIADGASISALYFGNTCGTCAGGPGGGNNPDVE